MSCLGNHKNIYSVKKEAQLFVNYKTKGFLYFDKYEKEKNIEKLTLSMLTQMFCGENNSCKIIKEGAFPEEIIKLFNEIKNANGFSELKDKYSVFDLCVKYLTLKENKKRWAEKTPNNIFNLNFILHLYPDAKFIEIYRDPRAVSLSWHHAGFEYFKTSNIIECIKIWRSAISKGKELVSKLPYQYHQVKYEELINNPEKELRKICDFLEEEFDPRMLNAKIINNFFTDLENESGFSKIPLNRWKRGLNNNEKLFVDILTKKYRKISNYPDSDARLTVFNFISFLIFTIKKCIEGRKQLKLYIKSRLRGFLHFYIF